MDETESLRDQLFIANWEANRKFREHYRWSSAATHTDPAAGWSKRGGNYDPLRPDEWHKVVGSLLESVGIIDSPASQQMLEDFNDFDLLCGQISILCLGATKPSNPFYAHGRFSRFTILQHDDGNLEVVSSQTYDGSF